MTADQSRPVPRASAVGSIDRDALVRLGSHDSGCEAEYIAPATGWTDCGCADRIFALVRPVEGVTLTREEAEVALRWRRTQRESGSFYGYEDERLAARLEVSS